MLVLIVDDTEDVRFLARVVLSTGGFETREADSGPAALQLLADGLAPDLVLLDVQMPVMDGWETLAMIRGNPETANVPVVFCTVRGMPEDLMRGWELGCDGYIRKPYDLDQLVNVMRSVAARPSRQRDSAREAELSLLRSRL